MAQAIHKAMVGEPSIDWLLENQEKITHKYFQMVLDGKKINSKEPATNNLSSWLRGI